MSSVPERTRMLQAAKSAIAQAANILQDMHEYPTEADLQEVIAAANQARQAAKDLDVLNGILRSST